VTGEHGRTHPGVERPEAAPVLGSRGGSQSLTGSFGAAGAFPGHIDMLWSELKTVVRGLIRAPSLSAAAVVTLALGIGANTAIFSIV
jgi:hypothetical protein